MLLEKSKKFVFNKIQKIVFNNNCPKNYLFNKNCLEIFFKK